MDYYKSNIPIINVDSSEHNDILFPKDQSFGLVPRDYSVDPEEMFAPPTDMKLIPRSEWDARYDEQEETKSSLEHVYLSGPNGTPAFENLDQDGLGDCWTFSVGHSVMVDRLYRNLPLVRFNPHAVAVMLNQLNGGWCGLSAKFVRENGIAVEGNGPGQWPGHSRSKSYITQALRDDMAQYKLVEEWVDLTRSEYDQNLTTDQVATCGFNNIVGPGDYNWWRHSVCRLRWVRIERGSWGQLILNSWPKWGRYGLGVLRGSQATCNGGLGIRLTSG